MQFTGQILSINKDCITGKYSITVSLDQSSAPEDLRGIFQENVDLIIKKHREKRSLNANSYYWSLAAKLAKSLEISNSEVHNLLLQRYGEIEKVDGQLIAVQLPDNEKTIKEIRQKTEYHLAPTSKVVGGKNGMMNRVYLMMRGSSTYNTAEMSRLIKGLISECKEAGLSDGEIMTPYERQRLEEQYGIKMEDATEKEENLEELVESATKEES